MPDIFVPADTTGLSMYFAQVSNSGLIYRYSLKYTESHREELNRFSTATEISNYLEKQSVLDKFIEFASENGVQPVQDDLDESGEIIKLQIKAYIARNILDNKGFYPIWQQLDKTLQKAIEHPGLEI